MPAFCGNTPLTSDDASNDYAVADPPYPDGTFTIGDKMPDGNPQDCEYKGTKNEAGKLTCWGREYNCKEWRLDDGTSVCYDLYLGIYGPKNSLQVPRREGKARSCVKGVRMDQTSVVFYSLFSVFNRPSSQIDDADVCTALNMTHRRYHEELG